MKTNFENLSKKFETYLKNNKDLQIFLRFFTYPLLYFFIIILFLDDGLNRLNNYLLLHNYNFEFYIEQIFIITFIIILISACATVFKYSFIISTYDSDDELLDELTFENIYLENKIQKLEKILESKN